MTVPDYRTTPARAEALASLYLVIGAFDDKGRTPPCMTSTANWWLSDDPGEQEAAAWRCMACPAIAACADYIDQHTELAGVWAGTVPADRRPKRRGKGHV